MPGFEQYDVGSPRREFVNHGLGLVTVTRPRPTDSHSHAPQPTGDRHRRTSRENPLADYAGQGVISPRYWQTRFIFSMTSAAIRSAKAVVSSSESRQVPMRGFDRLSGVQRASAA